MRVLARRPKKHRELSAWGCEIVQGDMTDPGSLRRAAEGCEAVVHLVAILLGKPETFVRVKQAVDPERRFWSDAADRLLG